MLSKVEATDIAIIGMSGKFPGAKNIAEFWANMKNGIDSRQEFRDDDLKKNGIGEEQINHPEYKKVGMILDEIEKFDAEFFNFTPYEAKVTDPQHRIFLECVWEALEEAGYAPSKYQGKIGLFGSTSMSSYLINNIIPNEKIDSEGVNYPILIGNDKDFLSTRIAYKLNLTGPSITIQTACSSSLVATHYGVQSILNGECDIAIAGGVSVSVPQTSGYLYKEGGILSRDGRCRPFDQNASGTIKGNGCGVVVLKSLSEAIKDKDHIYSVIKSTAINNDGSNKVGFTAPSIKGQESVIDEALYLADIESHEVGYIEAHGTGTSLGDPIEIQALNKVYGGNIDKHCAIGSVKANIGHTDAAAGVIGVIKTALSLKHQMVVPTPNFGKENENLYLEQTPFYIADKLEKKKLDYAGVSSFGIGGTNAHIIMKYWEEETDDPIEEKESNIVLLSAKNSVALSQMKEQLQGFLKKNENLSLGDVAYTLSSGRTEFNNRYFAIASSVDELIAQLSLEQNVTPIENDMRVSFKLGYNDLLWKKLIEHPSFQEIVHSILENCNEVDSGITKESILVDSIYREINYFVYNLALARKLIELGIVPEVIIANSKLDDLILFVLGEVISLKEAIEAIMTMDPVSIVEWDDKNSKYSAFCSDGNFYNKMNKKFIFQQTSSLTIEKVKGNTYVSKSNNSICFEGLTLGDKYTNFNRPPYECYLSILGCLWTSGMNLDIGRTVSFKNRVSLPTYPFQKERYWIEAKQKNREVLLNPAENEIPNNIENIVLDTWQKYLEIDSIEIEDNYYDLGGDSLAAVEIVSELRDVLKVNISIDQFTDMQTPKDLIVYIQNQEIKKKHTIVKKIREGINPQNNLFLVHPAGGNNLCYSQMNRFIEKDDWNIYVISYPINIFRNESLKEIASYYVEIIEEIQPHGEYVIGGYSFGGNVAFEMALQLQNKNRVIKSLMMFDSHPPEAYFGESISHDYFVRAFPFVIEMFLNGNEIDLQKLTEYENKSFDEIVEKLIENMDMKVDKKDLEQFFTIWKHNHNALKTYYPEQKLATDILYFEASEKESNEVLDVLKIKRVNKSTWHKHISGNFYSTMVQGNHYSMFGDIEKVKDLAKTFDHMVDNHKPRVLS
ncbi:type I polyketide synthase [Viridibacillus sp. NPDC096237]|uniref:type I polyketide synthase n=1 Tax=Viridibacillus sp. NPDC096237 TaxID=3390721 RepID=UPI003D086DCA